MALIPTSFHLSTYLRFMEGLVCARKGLRQLALTDTPHGQNHTHSHRYTHIICVHSHTGGSHSCTFLATTSATSTFPKQAWEPPWKGQVSEQKPSRLHARGLAPSFLLSAHLYTLPFPTHKQSGGRVGRLLRTRSPGALGLWKGPTPSGSSATRLLRVSSPGHSVQMVHLMGNKSRPGLSDRSALSSPSVVPAPAGPPG